MITVPDEGGGPDQVSATPSQLETLRSVIGKIVFLQVHQTSDGKHHPFTIKINGEIKTQSKQINCVGLQTITLQDG